MPCFSKKDRLLKTSEFALVKKNGLKVGGKAFFLSFVSGPIPRLGLVVSKKIGKAVVRNRIKRVLREYFRNHKHKFLSGDIVLVAKPQAASLTNQELRQQIENLINRLIKKTKQ